jgi:uncharacterized protein YyaL (SSP411 family)
MSDTSDRRPNRLIHETSPYLLQHAYNPVDWLPFTQEAFDIARREDKPVLISIGYSACHWCHVMERESFEDREVAALMNAHFINIKVDREERSDVDMLYMQAVQLMTGQGGWPLNCFVMPDGRPFYGGTYFNKTQWKGLLKNLVEIYSHNREKVETYATDLTKGIRESELILTGNRPGGLPDASLLRESVARWKTRLDQEHGGPNRAPKFPLPSNYQFLLRYAWLEQDKALQDHVALTLKKMAFGGIYDQLRGGFARYSTDTLWKVPHFEKMLYDNAQLVSLYCEAYLLTGDELYKETAEETLAFTEAEWLTEEGAFYSAYDADSEGEEGKYYVWSEAELRTLLGEDYELFSEYYGINERGYWEDGNYILMRTDNLPQLLVSSGLEHAAFREKVASWKRLLKQAAASRVKPGLDDKSITSWNAMMCSAYARASLAFGSENYKAIALRSADFIRKKLIAPDGRLYRTYKNGIAKIGGFLEDYAFVTEAFQNCYLITADESFLRQAMQLTGLALEVFHNPESDLLYYTDKEASGLVARTTEIGDNVIPSSNSQMAINLFQLGLYFDRSDWTTRAEKMLGAFQEEIKSYGAGYSNWACLALNLAYPFREIAIVGNHVDENFRELYQQGITNAIFAVHDQPSDLSLAKDRYVEGETLFYVCENKTCQQPVRSVAETLTLLV